MRALFGLLPLVLRRLLSELLGGLQKLAHGPAGRGFRLRSRLEHALESMLECQAQSGFALGQAKEKLITLFARESGNGLLQRLVRDGQSFRRAGTGSAFNQMRVNIKELGQALQGRGEFL